MFAKVWNHLGGCGEDAAVTEEAVVSGVAAFHGRTEVESPNDAAAVSDDNGRRRLKQKQRSKLRGEHAQCWRLAFCHQHGDRKASSFQHACFLP